MSEREAPTVDLAKIISDIDAIRTDTLAQIPDPPTPTRPRPALRLIKGGRDG